MKTSIFTFACFLLFALVSGCSEKEDVSPCLEARVINLNDECSGNVLLEIKKEVGGSATGGFCGTPSFFKYVTVDNLPADLKHEGARFTCQIKDVKSQGRFCPAIYMTYEAATITNICSQDTAPVVAAGK